MEFEDILLDVGDYGKYQRNLMVLFLVPAATLLPWFSMNIMFMVSVPDHWCAVPALINSNMTLTQQRALISPPGEHCKRYDLNYTEILYTENYTVPNGSTTRPCDQGWQYDKTNYESTATSKWDMVCDDAHYVSFVLSLNNVGSIIGTPIYGALSDRIGRKITFFIVIIVTAITAISSVLMQDFTWFIVLKTINGSLMPSVFQLPYIIILELVAPEVRTRMNGIVNLSWTVGLCFLPLLAYYSRDWVTLGLITSSVTILYLLYYTFLPESPRWLVSQERYDAAADIMYKISQTNGKENDKDTLVQKLQKLGEKMKKEKTEDGVKNSSGDLLRYPELRKRFLIITFCWMANIMSYYGLQLNASNLAGNEFINFFILSLVEIPGYLTSWVIMEKFGRRWFAATGFILTGMVCMVPIGVSEIPYGDVVCSMLGKYLSAATFMATYQQSSELYPTVVRSLAMGMSSTVAMVATLIVPYLVYLSVYGKAIPFIVIGMFGIVAGILAAFLPETLNENLPQTIFDAEQFGKNQKFFSFNKRRVSISRERAASLAGKCKNLEAMSRDQSKSQRSSSVLENVEFVNPGKWAVSQESVKTLNSETSTKGASSTECVQRRESDKTANTNKFSYVNVVFNNNNEAANKDDPAETTTEM